jgi:thiamine pyrophosphate-dependent acetolactate synthase large subunit-like protein
MRVFEALAEELVRVGVTTLFSVPSSGTMKIALCAKNRGVAHLSTRHEQAAVGMADGYARVSGSVGVALVGRGPGLTNSANALITAQKAGSPVLLISGHLSTALARDPAAARRDLSNMQTIDQEAFLSAIGVTHMALEDPETAVADLRAAYKFAAVGRPVVVLLPGDVAEKGAGAAGPRVSLPAASAECPAPDPEDVGLVCDLLGERWAARHPVVLAGRGAVRANALGDLIRLAEVTGALLGTTLAAKGAFDGLPYDIGVIGTESTPVASELLLGADIVLAFGASLNQFTTYGGDLLKNARVVHVDTLADAFGAYQPVDIPILADAQLAASALVTELEARGQSATGYRSPEVADKITSERMQDWLRDEGRPGALDPRIVLDAVNRLLPEERAIVVDVGAHVSFTSRFLSASDPRAFLLSHDYGSVGAGMGIALGAAVARPDRLTVLATGDGGLMMTLADLDTAVRYGLPLAVIVMNDGGFGQEVQLLALEGLPPEVAQYANPPFAAVAEALGGEGLRVDTLDDLAGLDERLAERSGPFVLDCAVSGDIRGEHIDLLLRMRRKVVAAEPR